MTDPNISTFSVTIIEILYIQLEYIPTKEKDADIFNKGIDTMKFWVT